MRISDSPEKTDGTKHKQKEPFIYFTFTYYSLTTTARLFDILSLLLTFLSQNITMRLPSAGALVAVVAIALAVFWSQLLTKDEIMTELSISAMTVVEHFNLTGDERKVSARSRGTTSQ